MLVVSFCSALPYMVCAEDTAIAADDSYEEEDDDGGDGVVYDEVRLNIVAFEVRDQNFEFESLITGTYAQLFHAFEGKADVIFLNRTPVIKDGDVLNIQEDALRMAGDKLANDGLNCTFSFTNMSDEDSQFYAISGLCNIMYAGVDGTRKVRAIIQRTVLSEANYGVNAWISIYQNKKTGIIIYADVDPK
ncbi:MAG: hypothetical protein Q9M14_03155 [Mariprofundaceae bacterium]|nr:hypothetical protein [Mariprofundaceae bacterium]